MDAPFVLYIWLAAFASMLYPVDSLPDICPEVTTSGMLPVTEAESRQITEVSDIQFDESAAERTGRRFMLASNSPKPEP